MMERELVAMRSKLRIICDILVTTEEGATKTRIQYEACLSYAMMQRYLEGLLKESLLKKESNCYYTTADGAFFIQLCQICFSLCDLL